MRPKYGICTGLGHLQELSEAGFDFVEVTTYIFAQADEKTFSNMVSAVEQSDIACEACNGFYPLDFHVTGDNIDIRTIYAYIDKAITRAHKLGVRNITIGSGPARRVPEGFPKMDAFCQFGDQVRYAGKLASKYGITVTIEPLSPKGTNLINNLAEGTALAKYVRLPNVKTMADINQMTEAGDSIDLLYRYGDYIGHIHTYDTKGQCYPSDPDDPQQLSLLKAYLSVNPGGRISVEGGKPSSFEPHPFTSVENARQCLLALKNYVARAQDRKHVGSDL